MAYNENMETSDGLNTELANEEVPNVSWEIFHWRMSLRIRDIKAAAPGASFGIPGNH